MFADDGETRRIDDATTDGIVLHHRRVDVQANFRVSMSAGDDPIAVRRAMKRAAHPFAFVDVGRIVEVERHVERTALVRRFERACVDGAASLRSRRADDDVRVAVVVDVKEEGVAEVGRLGARSWRLPCCDLTRVEFESFAR